MVDVDNKIVKIADFGLARPVDAPVAFTYQVCSFFTTAGLIFVVCLLPFFFLVSDC